jgi:hypothetical protein
MKLLKTNKKKKIYLTERWKELQPSSFLFLYSSPPQTQEQHRSLYKPLQAQNLKSFLLPIGFQGLGTGNLRGQTLRGFYSSAARLEALKPTKDLVGFGLRWGKTWYSEKAFKPVLAYETAAQLYFQITYEFTKSFQGFAQILQSVELSQQNMNPSDPIQK